MSITKDRAPIQGFRQSYSGSNGFYSMLISRTVAKWWLKQVRRISRRSLIISEQISHTNPHLHIIMRKALMSFMIYVIISQFYPAKDMLNEEWGCLKCIILVDIMIMYRSVVNWVWSHDQ